MTVHAYTPTSPKVVEGPQCEKCGTTMHIIRMEPDKPGYDLRTFRCEACENVMSLVVPSK